MDPPSEFPANDIPDEMHNEYANCSPDNMSDMSDELINMHFRSELPDIPDELPYELANAIPDDRSDAPDDLILDTEAEFWQGQERSLEADLSSSAASSSFLDLPAELDPATADTLSLDEPLRMVSTTELRAFAMKYLEPTDEVPPYLESFWPTLVLEKSLLDFAEFLSDENYIGKDYAFTIRKTSGQAPTAYCLVLEPNPNGPDLSSFGPLTNQMDFQANYDILHQIMQGVQADGFSGLVLGLSDVYITPHSGPRESRMEHHRHLGYDVRGSSWTTDIERLFLWSSQSRLSRGIGVLFVLLILILSPCRTV